MPFLWEGRVVASVWPEGADRRGQGADRNTTHQSQSQVRRQKGKEVTTRADITDASQFATEQRLRLLSLLRADTTKAAHGDVETCKKALALSVSDPMKFDAALPHHVTAKLFSCGALYFEKAAA